jgi:hypothetical protein
MYFNSIPKQEIREEHAANISMLGFNTTDSKALIVPAEGMFDLSQIIIPSGISSSQVDGITKTFVDYYAAKQAGINCYYEKFNEFVNNESPKNYNVGILDFMFLGNSDNLTTIQTFLSKHFADQGYLAVTFVGGHIKTNYWQADVELYKENLLDMGEPTKDFSKAQLEYNLNFQAAMLGASKQAGYSATIKNANMYRPNRVTIHIISLELKRIMK